MSDESYDSGRNRITVDEAARALGISESAVRERVKRGTLEHERTPDGRLVVYLDNAATRETDRERILDESLPARTERYIRGLEDRVEHLRNELDQDREANHENKLIIAALEERIAELEPAETSPVEPERSGLHHSTIDPSDAVLVQYCIKAGASITAAVVLIISVLNGQVVLAGLAGGLLLLSVASLLIHWLVFRDSQAVKKKLPLPLDLLIQLIVVLALVFGFVRPFVMEAFWIPSGSMIPTLKIGDRVLVNKFIYRFTEPKRGDIIVFESVDNPDEDLIKRVVGVPGDEIAEKNGTLYVNGKPQKEPYLNKKLPDRSNFAKTTVPENSVYVMGDNRANSADSRYFGPLPEKNIEGEAFLRFWPPNRIGLL